MGKWIFKQSIIVFADSNWDLSSSELKAFGTLWRSPLSPETERMPGWEVNSSLEPIMEGEWFPCNSL